MQRTLITLLVALVLSAAVVAAQRDVSPEQLQQLLKRFPDADANKDGTLTLEEARPVLCLSFSSSTPKH